MKVRNIILNSIFWRSVYFATVLLLNIIVSRYFQATGSGWIYYITNYFSFILLLASLNLESGMIFFASKGTIPAYKLATLALVWSGVASVIIVALLFFIDRQKEPALTPMQFIFFSSTYIAGFLLSSFFSALFSAQQRFSVPNLVLAVTNLLLIFSAPVIIHFNKLHNMQALFLDLYFFNFLLQGVVLGIAYTTQNKIVFKCSLPGADELRMLFRYSLTALGANIVFFLLYRIDYWFIKNMCKTCYAGDLGNYIQVSKLGQLFLLLPTFIAAAIFPRTAAGFKEQVNSWLPVLVKTILLLDAAALLLLVITGEWLFPWVYGETFNRMYGAFILLIPGILSLSVIAVISAYNAGKDRVSVNMRGGLIGLSVVIAGDWWLIPQHGIKAAATVSSAGYLGYLIYLLVVFKKEYDTPLSDFFVPVKSDWRRLQQILSHAENRNV